MRNNMKQIKFTIESDIVSAFKDKCAYEGVSMTSAIKSCMRNKQPASQLSVKTQTGPQRKRAVVEIMCKLSEILEKHERYRDSIPEQFAQRYEAADEFCEKVAEAIDILGDSL